MTGVEVADAGASRLRVLTGALGSLLHSELGHALGRGTPVGETSRRRARDVRRTLEGLGPFYVKMGQILSTRPDIVSDEMINELRTLHDTASVRPFEEFEPVLHDELGPRWRSRFRDVDTTRPLGAASLAQVYAATMPDGQPVVIKVQRPGIAPVVEADMRLLRRAVRLFSRFAPTLTELIDLEAMLGMLFDAMRAELDLTVEARQMDQVRADVADFKHLDVPEVLLVTPRVMIQSRAPGRSIRDVDPAEFPTAERMAIGRDLMAFMYRSYLTTRVFHADPHPGNIFVCPGQKASLLDWGMIGRIDRRTSHAVLMLLLNISMNDGQGAARAWIGMGRATGQADVPAFQNDMEALVPKLTTASLKELDFGLTFTSVLKSSTKRGIRTNPAIAVLGKSFANLDGSIRYLAPELSTAEVFRDELRTLTTDLLTETLSDQHVARTALELLTVDDAVVQSQTVLRDLANGQLQLRLPTPAPTDKRRGKICLILGAALAGFLWRRKPPR
ncbi:ABC1 kinase family protein [Saccharothrix xinjiangensis]|uniref:ABC1 kinase family protein n=1 Tax=Saccharothrix xinjiangensis TaxID=204798 RepID=A0ABV9YAT4_9PSEU